MYMVGVVMGVMVCDLVVVVMEWRYMNVARVVLVFGWWLWVYSSRSDDSVMVCVCYPGSSEGVVVYMITAVVVVGWCVCACGRIVVVEI